jgi:hypothetical protein
MLLAWLDSGHCIHEDPMEAHDALDAAQVFHYPYLVEDAIELRLLSFISKEF